MSANKKLLGTHRVLTITAFLLLLVTVSTAVAQSAQFNQLREMVMQMEMTQSAFPDQILGHPYLHNDWKQGAFSIQGEAEYDELQLKFELVSGVVGVMFQGDSLYLRPQLVPQFRYNVNGEEFLFRNGFRLGDVNLSRDTYLRVLFDEVDEWSLFMHYRKVFLDAEQPRPYGDYRRDPVFEERYVYLVRSPEGEWSTFRPTRRNIGRLFEDGREANNYIRSNNLNYTSIHDMSRLFKHLAGQ
jgi:hypothetical protein